ncbi:uncharacterized protein LOC124410958 [Diprion similis]|uniref:uncharacterized protein LOC124410958 n=1 Tax=Diprion similis TaxID=362088 RepID=UPI001EF86E15|nr:uncharacterized protein LOC124410958 [Diprion similis]
MYKTLFRNIFGQNEKLGGCEEGSRLLGITFVNRCIFLGKQYKATSCRTYVHRIHEFEGSWRDPPMHQEQPDYVTNLRKNEPDRFHLAVCRLSHDGIPSMGIKFVAVSVCGTFVASRRPEGKRTLQDGDSPVGPDVAKASRCCRIPALPLLQTNFRVENLPG